MIKVPAAPQEYRHPVDAEVLNSVEHAIDFFDRTFASCIPTQILEDLRLSAEILSILYAFKNLISDKEALVVLFLHYLMSTSFGSQFNRQAKRVISKAYKELQVDVAVVKSVEERLAAEMSDYRRVKWILSPFTDDITGV